ncbi:hypothetical protein NC653_029213 [Populus alba x Populus x berolinensis]|uniref:Uncharacterized protein n=1 Tax=Populus alba x Populus x berolinensis TaxID=444605 RepID=A0AAD6M1K4_9ROSI|nr:hypothetical protein NC653_029213 [Populus alba x Populus x berolinensis]
MKRLLAATVRPPLGGSFVASVLVRETVACGRWKREDLSAALSVAERSTAGREKIWGEIVAEGRRPGRQGVAGEGNGQKGKRLREREEEDGATVEADL